MSIYEILTYQIPKHIVHNDWDEHKYLGPVFMMFAIGVVFIFTLYQFSKYTPVFLVLLAAIYYAFILRQLIRYDYDFDINQLGLSEQTKKIVSGTTQTFRNRITFFSIKMTKDVIGNLSSDQKKSVISEIKGALHPKKFSGTIAIQGGYVYQIKKDNLEIDIEFLHMLIKELNMPIDYEDIQNLKAIGVKI